jgi:flagellar protein FlaG
MGKITFYSFQQNSEIKTTIDQQNTEYVFGEQNSAGPGLRKQSKEEVENGVSSLNRLLEPSRIQIKFELHEQLNDYYVTVIDVQTNETIR